VNSGSPALTALVDGDGVEGQAGLASRGVS
jgi:hypothetical protein